MNSQQNNKELKLKTEKNNQSFSKNTVAKKQNDFMAHFDSLRDSRTDSQKESRTTTNTNYQQIFEDYSKKHSQIDDILKTFDNGLLYEPLNKQHQYIQTNAHLLFANQMKSRIEEVSKFFQHSQPLQKIEKISDIMSADNYSLFFASHILPLNNEEQTYFCPSPKLQRIESERINLNANKKENSRKKQQKIDLLLAQISSEKRRKNQSKFYGEALYIKLNEFIDYITQDDERYLGLPLSSKAFEILKNIDQYRGKQIEGYLKLPLLEYFFLEFKQLQKGRLADLKFAEKQEQKIQVCSQLKLKQSKLEKNSGKYSQPNKKKRQQIREQDWIGKLQ